MLEVSEQEKEPTPEELQSFREEIKALYEAEKTAIENGRPTTGHFLDSFGQGLSFIPEDLGAREFKLWWDYKSCLGKENEIDFCLQSLDDYRRGVDHESTSLAIRGLISFVGNKINNISVAEQIARRRAQRENN